MTTPIGASYNLASRHPDTAALERAFEFGRMLERMIREHPDVDLASIRLEERPRTLGVPHQIRITGATR